MDSSLLEVRDVRIYYSSVRGEYKVVDGVSFDVKSNEILERNVTDQVGMLINSKLINQIHILLVFPSLGPGHNQTNIFLNTSLCNSPKQSADILTRINVSNINYKAFGELILFSSTI